jgi:hypothetical protein
MVDAPPPFTPEPSLGETIGSGFAWGVLCAIGTGIGAVAGHLAGTWVYPYQLYEQVPTILLFVPLGLIVGFFVAGWARIARPQWRGREMLSVVGWSAGGYAFAMFWYARTFGLLSGPIQLSDPQRGFAPEDHRDASLHRLEGCGQDRERRVGSQVVHLRPRPARNASRRVPSSFDNSQNIAPARP